MKAKLTETSVLKLKLQPGQADEFFFDEKIPGFGVRIRDGGSRKYLFQYRYGGKSRRLIFGEVGSLDFGEAQKRARRARVALDDGKDPAFEKAANKAAGKVTFGSIADDYMKFLEQRMAQGNLKPRSEVEIRRHVMEHFKPLHGRPIVAITRVDVAARLREIAQANGPGAADRTRSNVSTFFAWAIGEGICETNPVMGTNRHAEATVRERSLIDADGDRPNYDEIIAVWKGCPDSEYGKIVRLLILTLCRRDEIGSLERAEIDKEARLIRLPGARTKNGREHVVPLSDAAMVLLDTVETREGRALVFGSGKGGYSGWSKSKREMDEATPLKKPWTLHDLRRTGRTALGLLGVAPHIAEAVLNHLPPKLMRTYDKNKYEREKREALDLWAAHLLRIVAGEQSNVIPIRA